MRPDAAAAFDPGLAYRLHRQAELRPEKFGALAYHFGTRRLSFLKAPVLVDTVRALEHHDSVYAALDACAVPEQQRPVVLAALAGLLSSTMIEPRRTEGAPS